MSSETQAPKTIPIKFLQEEECINQETKELMSTLPKHKEWIFSSCYQYQGFWHVSLSLQGTLALQRTFKARDNDIFLVTTPKSGTTWLKAMGFALINRAQYLGAVASADHPLLHKNPHELVPLIENEYQAVQEISSWSSPRLIATHLPIGSLPESVMGSKCKIVYMCRDPKDTFISMWHYVNKMRLKDHQLPMDEALDMFCKGVSHCGPFWDHVLGYWNASKDRKEANDKVFFIKYEEMKEQPSTIVKRMAEFIGYPFTKEEEAEGVVEDIVHLCSFKNLSSLDVNKEGKRRSQQDNNIYFRKGEAGGWVKEMKPEMALLIDQITKQRFSGTELKF